MVKGSISKKLSFLFLFICLAAALSGCSNRTFAGSEAEDNGMGTDQPEPDLSEPSESKGGFTDVTRETRVQDVIDSPVFGEYGRLFFPADRMISSELTLENVGDILIWYTHINPDKTVEIVNYLGKSATAGDTVFYDIHQFTTF